MQSDSYEGVSAERRFELERELVCRWCTNNYVSRVGGIVSGKKFTNVAKHAERKRHLDADPAKSKTPGGPAQTTLSSLSFGAPAAKSPVEIRRLRALTALRASNFAVKSNIYQLIGQGSLLLEAATLLNRSRDGLTRDTVAPAMEFGVKLLMEHFF